MRHSHTFQLRASFSPPVPTPAQLVWTLAQLSQPPTSLLPGETFQENTACQTLCFQSPTVAPSPRPSLCLLSPFVHGSLSPPEKSSYFRGYLPVQAESFSFTAYVVREGIKEIITDTADNLEIAWKPFLRRSAILQMF